MTKEQQNNLVTSQPFVDTIQSTNTDERINTFTGFSHHTLNYSFADSNYFSSPQINEQYSQMAEKYTNTEI
ncbi:MAG: hypothetical protein QNJ51_13320 [Calothrix sp. MO_167.B12]|nr:hypothetical protein [Calothrix sp. MO_167.B12]